MDILSVLLKEKYLQTYNCIYLLSGSYLSKEQHLNDKLKYSYSDVDIIRIQNNHNVSNINIDNKILNESDVVSIRNFHKNDSSKLPRWLYNIRLNAIKTIINSNNKILKTYKNLTYLDLRFNDIFSGVETAWIYCLFALFNIHEKHYPVTKLLLVLIRLHAQSINFFSCSYKENINKTIIKKIFNQNIAHKAYQFKIGEINDLKKSEFLDIFNECLILSHFLLGDLFENYCYPFTKYISDVFIEDHNIDKQCKNMLNKILYDKLKNLPYFEKGRGSIYENIIKNLNDV